MLGIARAWGRLDIVAEASAGLLLIAAMTFGGGSRGSGDAVVHLLAVPALWLALLRWPDAHRARATRWFAWWLAAAAMLIALQLLPIPAALFAQLPQRAAVLDDLHQAGLQPAWLPMTLDLWGTVRSVLALMSFAAITLLAITLKPDARRRLLMLALFAAVPMALLGFAQAAAGTQSSDALRFHDYHHPIGAIGLFANRNHFADLMTMLLPFALAFAAQAAQRRQRPRAMAWSALAVLLLLAAALSFSRAGIALAGAATAAMVLAIMIRGRGRERLLPVATLAIAAVGVAIYAWDGIVARLLQDPLDDLRWQYLHYGRQVMAAYWPVGSGLGSFRDVYAPFEPVTAMVQVYALHAHDDLLELLIETGAPGLALLCAFLALFIGNAFRKIRKSLRADTQNSRRLQLAAAMACMVPFLHSLVDYPLRTLAIASVFGLAWAEFAASSAARAPSSADDAPLTHRPGRG